MVLAKYQLIKKGKVVGYDTYKHSSWEEAKRDEAYSNKIKRDGFSYKLINAPRTQTVRSQPTSMFSTKGNLPRLLR